MKPVIKGTLIGIITETILVLPLLIGGWGHGIPANVLGWIPYALHTPAFLLWRSLGLSELWAMMASVFTMTLVWSVFAGWIAHRPSQGDHENGG